MGATEEGERKWEDKKGWFKEEEKGGEGEGSVGAW